MQRRSSTDPLFALIASLTPAERRYFRLSASLQGGEKGYLRLFDAIAAQREYDEKEIRKAFAGEAFVKQLHVAKHYLMEMILKGLRSYHAKISVSTQVYDLLEDATILWTKGLLDLCRTRLEKARTLAERFELYPLQLEILDLEDAWFVPNVEAPSIDVRRREVLDLMEHQFAYEALGEEINLMVIHEGKPRDASADRQLAEVIAHPLMESPEKARSFGALNSYYYVLSAYHYAMGDRAKAREATERRRDLFEAAPERIVENPVGYVAILTNLLVTCPDTEAEHFRELLALMRAVPARSRKRGLQRKRLEYRVFNFSYGLELGLLNRLGEFAQALALFDVIEEKQHELREYVHGIDLMRFRFYHAYALLGVGRYRDALNMIEFVIGESPGTMRRHVIRSARIVELILRYELAEYTLLEYRIEAVRRLLRRRESLFRFESIFLRHFKRVLDLGNQRERREWFRRLYDELAPLRNDPREGNAFGDFDFIAWLRSKAEGVEFAEGVRREMKERTLRDNRACNA